MFEISLFVEVSIGGHPFMTSTQKGGWGLQKKGVKMWMNVDAKNERGRGRWGGGRGVN